MGAAEEVISSILLHQVADTSDLQYFSTVFHHELESLKFMFWQKAVDAGQRHFILVFVIRVQVHKGFVVGDGFANGPNCYHLPKLPAHGLLMVFAPAWDYTLGIVDWAHQIRLGHTGAESAAASYTGNTGWVVIVPADAI